MLPQSSFPSSEIDATLPNEDTICQESAMDIELSATFVYDNKVENLPKDLTFHDNEIENIRDSQDLDAVPGSERCVMGIEDQETLVTEIVSSGEIKKSVENVITLDHLPFPVASADMKVIDASSALNQESLEQKSRNENLETPNEDVSTENEYRVVNHETQEEATMEKQEHDDLNEQSLEELVIDDHRDVNSEIVLGVDNELEVKDDSLSENFTNSMEVELKKPKHKEADTQSNVPSLPGINSVNVLTYCAY